MAVACSEGCNPRPFRAKVRPQGGSDRWASTGENHVRRTGTLPRESTPPAALFPTADRFQSWTRSKR
jgi:hypothetical protein